MIETLAFPSDPAVNAEAREATSQIHGIERFAAGFDITKVVAEYNFLRDVILHIAEEEELSLSAREHRRINEIIDGAVANAVDTFAIQQAVKLQSRREEQVAFLVHDVRSPLNSIALTTALLAEDCMGRDPDTDEMILTLQRSVQRIESLLHNVLQSQRNLGPGNELLPQRKEIDLWSLVERLLQEFAPVAADAGVVLRNAVPRLLTIDADTEQLARVFQNLIGNAIRFAPDGIVEIGGKAEDGMVQCWVRDDGSGIQADRIERVFDKLETDPDPKRAGLGLGLAIVRQIIEAHGGSILIQKRRVNRNGAVFRFALARP